MEIEIEGEGEEEGGNGGIDLTCPSYRLGLVSEEVGHDIILHDSHMSTAPRNADSATYCP